MVDAYLYICANYNHLVTMHVTYAMEYNPETFEVCSLVVASPLPESSHSDEDVYDMWRKAYPKARCFPFKCNKNSDHPPTGLIIQQNENIKITALLVRCHTCGEGVNVLGVETATHLHWVT